MPMLAVYIVPRPEAHLYQVASALLGYDVRRAEAGKPACPGLGEPAALAAWVGMLRYCGFHATLGDAMEYASEVVPEVRARLAWLARRIPPFTLQGGRIHDTYRNVPRTLAATFDCPDGTLQKLEHLVVRLVNVLYAATPLFAHRTAFYPAPLRSNIRRYGAPYVLDEFDLHFSFATNLPNLAAWRTLRAALVDGAGLFARPEQRVLRVDEIHLLERQADGFFRIAGAYALGGDAARRAANPSIC